MVGAPCSKAFSTASVEQVVTKARGRSGRTASNCRAAPVLNRADMVHYAVDDPDFYPAPKSDLDLAACLKQVVSRK